MVQALSWHIHTNASVRESDTISGASETSHTRADNLPRSGGIEPDRKTLAHTSRPVINEHDDRSAVDGSSAWRHQFQPAAPDSSLALFRRQHVLLVWRLSTDESTQNPSCDASVATTWRIPQVNDEGACLAQITKRTIK